VVAPVTLTLLMVAVAVPVLVSVTCCEALLPVNSEPKLTLVLEALSVAEGAVPVPLAVMFVGEFVALLAIEIVAASAPAL
jgi:hypothetical protein